MNSNEEDPKKGFLDRHPLIAILIYPAICLIVILTLNYLTGSSGSCSRTDPETGDVWGP